MQKESTVDNKLKENKMGTMPVGRLLITMALPMMISMLVQALYNIVDSIFVSWISEDAFTAVSLAFPMQNFMIAVASGTGVGMNALLSKSLGEKKQDLANKAAMNGIFLAVCSWIFFCIIGFFFVPMFMQAQTNTKDVYEYGCSYLYICLFCSFACLGQVTMERLLQSTGKTVYSMIAQASGAVVNIVLDYVLIFPCGLGVSGAAIATIIGQCVGLLLGLFFNLKVNKEIQLSVKGFRPELGVIRKIYAVGLPSIVMGSIGSIMTFFMNIILKAFASATAVFGAYFKVQSFIFMPVFGLNNAMVPIISYNYGARKPKRIMKTIKLSIIYAVAMMLCGFAAFQLIPDLLLQMFEASPAMLALGVPAFRTISLSFLFAGFCIVAGSVFQALGKGVRSLIVSVVRQLVVLIPVAFLLSLSGVVDYIWWAFPIAEIFSMGLSVLFLYQIYQKEIKPLGAEG